MDHTKAKRANARAMRVKRIRKKLRGTGSRPRLSVSKTNQHLYAQLIDDERKITLAGVGTLSEVNQKAGLGRKSKTAAKTIGRQIAELAKKLDVHAVIFDRGRFKYHGHIAELATGAREAGLQF
jgi:large subunit ribosomal protein L18